MTISAAVVVVGDMTAMAMVMATGIIIMAMATAMVMKDTERLALHSA